MRGRWFSVCEGSTGLITRSWAKLKRASSVIGLSSRHGPASTRREISSRIDRAAETGFSPYRGAYHDLLLSPFAHAVNSEDSVLSSWLAELLFVPDDELSKILNIRESAASSNILGSEFVYHFRSWRLSANHFRTVLKGLETGGEDVRPFQDVLLYLDRPAEDKAHGLDQNDPFATDHS